MKQIIQNLKTGQTILEETPAPQVSRGQVLIQTTRSLVSLGTERMLVEFGKASLISKARQQPDKVKQVLDKIQSEGLMPTLEAVFNKLEQPLPLGYCNVGKVVSVGEGVTEFKIGDRVASNGQHAEFVTAPKNLVAHIPDNVSDEEATFTVIGSIGLQGIRLCNPTFGETIVVVGLGLIGLITAELLIANGCKVIGIDIDEQKLALAREKGIIAINSGGGNDPVETVLSQTGQVGADGVIITASAKTDAIISQAARMSRKRGRIILVGVIGLNLSRAEFYEKELTFQVSCSYGPGRYDDQYEQKGNDYPLAFVRWTEKRNFEAILHGISSQRLDVKRLITERIPLPEYEKIYGQIGSSRSIASVLVYPEKSEYKTSVEVIKDGSFKAGPATIGIIGAGNFTKMTMLPALKKVQAEAKYISSAGGVSGTHLAKKYQIPFSTTDYKDILGDKESRLVMITTRHNLHASMARESLAAGKHVFVEKPLALNAGELEEVTEAYKKANASSGVTLTVGYNRRFSPHIQAIKKALGNNPGPMNLIGTMNAGAIPPNVWVHDLKVGGGRIIGEACHYLDLMIYLSGSKISAVCMNALEKNPQENTDNASILVRFENGSNGVVNYFSNGHKAYSKERLEVYHQGRVAIMDNFRKTEAYGFKGFKGLKTSLDKGHTEQFKRLVTTLRSGGPALIPFEELVNSTKASFAAIESLKSNCWINIE